MYFFTALLVILFLIIVITLVFCTLKFCEDAFPSFYEKIQNNIYYRISFVILSFIFFPILLIAFFTIPTCIILANSITEIIKFIKGK